MIVICLTNASLAVSVEIVAHSAAAAISQTTVISSVTQNTDVLTAPSISTARVTDCTSQKIHDQRT